MAADADPDTSNLLSFLRLDPNPPIAPTGLRSQWGWYVKPLLLHLQRYGAATTTTTAVKILPPLWPNDLFAAHRMHARKVYRQMNDDDDDDDDDDDEDDEDGRGATLDSAAERWNRANDRAVRRANELAFDTEAVANANGTLEAADWVRKMCVLDDPYGFPNESIVYENVNVLAAAIEMIERNSAQLEQIRREHRLENQQLLNELRRFQGAVNAIEQLPVNLGRVLSERKPPTSSSSSR